jgi:O-antigen/teichoic acid export membrane protein
VTLRLAQRGGNAVAWKAVQLGGIKCIFLLRTLILARLLAPEDFGLLAIATVAVGLLLSVTDLGMTPALIQRADVSDREYDVAWNVNAVRAVAVSAILFAFAPGIAALFAEPRAAGVLAFLAFRPLVEASGSIKLVGLIRLLDHRRLAIVALAAAVIDTIVAVALASHIGVWALVAGTLSGAIVSAAASHVIAPYRPRVVLAADTLRPLTRYGRWIFLTGVVAIAANAAVQLLIARRLGTAELGLYVLATRLGFLPSEIAGQVVGEVAFSVYARLQDDRARVARAFRSILVGLATMLVPASVLLVILAPWLVRVVLGDRWQGSESMIQLLVLAGIAGLFSDATAPLFKGVGRPDWVLRLDVLQATLVITLTWLLTEAFAANGAALAWLIAITVAQVPNYVLASRLIRRPLSTAGPPLVIIVIASASGGMTALLAVWVFSGIGGLALAGLGATAMAVLVLWSADRRFDLGLGADLLLVFPQLARLKLTRLTGTTAPAR